MFRNAYLLALAAVISAPASAGAPAGQVQSAAKSDKSDDKIVCRFVNSTGSRLSRERQCKTRADWERESDETRDDIDRQRDRPTGDPMNGPH